MGKKLVTTKAVITCPHGGQGILVTSNVKVFVTGAPVLLETDVQPLTPCSHMIGNSPAPCLTSIWQGQGAKKITVLGIAPLLKSSEGDCPVSGAKASVKKTQGKVSGK